jgi:hypothetical protein
MASAQTQERIAVLKHGPADQNGVAAMGANMASMSAMLKAIVKDDDYDEEFLPPTPYALAEMRLYLEAGARSLGTHFPIGSLTPDGEGGVRASWRGSDKEMSLSVGDTGQREPYAYFEDATRYDVIENVSREDFVERLGWFAGAE